MTGIELLQMVKDNELEDGTLVRTTGPFPQYYLFRKNGEHPNFGKCDPKGDAGGMYGQYKFMTTKALFRDYEIVEVLRETPNKLDKITVSGEEIKFGSLSKWIGNCSDNELKICRAIESTAIVTNELIDTVNYLLDTQNS